MLRYLAVHTASLKEKSKKLESNFKLYTLKTFKLKI